MGTTEPELWVHSPVEIINPVLEMCRQSGIKIVRDVDFTDATIRDPNKVHLIWGMPHYRPFHEWMAERRNYFHIENGWMTPSRTCCLDARGTNGMSTVRDSINDNSPIDREKVDKHVEFIRHLTEVHNHPKHLGDDYIFVPLQCEGDSQLRHWSNINDFPWGDVGKRQIKLLNDVCEAFPDRQIVVKPHPSNKDFIDKLRQQCRVVGKHPKLELLAGEDQRWNSYQWIQGSALVIGINSTVLTEAVLLAKPVLAVGQGIFSGNGVVAEMRGCDPTLMWEHQHWKPDQRRIDQYLTLLLERQIPYNITIERVKNYPVLVQMIETCKTWPTG